MPTDPSAAPTDPGTPPIGQVLVARLIERLDSGRLRVVVPSLSGRGRTRTVFGHVPASVSLEEGDELRVGFDETGGLTLIAWEHAP